MSTAVNEQTQTWKGYVDPSGAQVDSRDAAFAATDVSPEAISTTAKLTLHNGAGVTFTIAVEFSPNTYPFRLIGGEITGSICGAPWKITGGVLGDELRVDARRAGEGSCAETITVVGEFVNPSAYRGTYGFNGTSSSFPHTTIFHG
jgi:hypothetical protein